MLLRDKAFEKELRKVQSDIRALKRCAKIAEEQFGAMDTRDACLEMAAGMAQYMAEMKESKR